MKCLRAEISIFYVAIRRRLVIYSYMLKVAWSIVSEIKTIFNKYNKSFECLTC